MKKLNKKNRIVSFDLIRCIATFCIVLFHFMINGKHIYPTEYFFKNYDLAQVGVSLFFVLSGASLYYSNRNDFKCKDYYKKRFLAIFPLFYITYFCIFFFSFWKEGNIIAGIPIRNLFFSLIGMDGFLSYKLPCFTMTGEWFLGCIIILYIIYPIIRKLIMKYSHFTMIISILVYLFLNYNYFFEIPILFNPLIRSVEFIFGMYLIELYSVRDLFNKINLKFLIPSFFVSLIMLYINIPIPQMFEITIGGCSLFVLLFEFGKLIKNNMFKNILKLSTKYSFSIFLVHHYIANIVQYHFINNNLSNFEIICTFVIYSILTLFFARLVLKIYDFILLKIKFLTNNEC